MVFQVCTFMRVELVAYNSPIFYNLFNTFE